MTGPRHNAARSAMAGLLLLPALAWGESLPEAIDALQTDAARAERLAGQARLNALLARLVTIQRHAGEPGFEPVRTLDILAAVEKNAAALSLPTAEAARLRAAISCTRFSLQSGLAPVGCDWFPAPGEGADVPLAETAVEPAPPAGPMPDRSLDQALAQTDMRAARARALEMAAWSEPREQPMRQRYAIAFYGHAVDLEIARFFALLAERDPELLLPTPIDPAFQIKSCINNNLLPVVGPDIAGARERYLSTMRLSAEPQIIDGDVFRYNLWQSDIAAVSARTGQDWTPDLTVYSEADAYRLTLADFSARFGLDVFAGRDLLSALHTLWVALDDKGFLSVVAAAFGRDVAQREVGAALAASGLSDRAVWSRLYRSAGVELNCSDADKIFEAYGLVYRRGDYPGALRVLRRLRQEMGYPAVPGVTLTQTSREFLEASPQNCALFGPVEEIASEADDDRCNLGSVDLGDGTPKHIVKAGGAEIGFYVTPDEQERLASYLADLESIDRDGDILRWSAHGILPIRTQTLGKALALEDWDQTEDTLPCLLDMSFYLDADDPDRMARHVQDYRDSFYPGTDASLAGTPWYVLLIDEFHGYQDPAFVAELGQSTTELNSLLSSLLSRLSAGQAEPPRVGDGPQPPIRDGGAGLSDFQTDTKALCAVLERQLGRAHNAAKVSHGAFIKGLLFGTAPGLPGLVRLGLLSPEDATDATELSQHVHTYAARGSIDQVATHIDNIVEALQRIHASTEQENLSVVPKGVVNISMGESYLGAPADAQSIARTAISTMKISFARSQRSALFVLAAGQPPIPETIEDQVALEHSVVGVRLDQRPTTDLTINEEGCSYFPACFSGLSNVITVGAVKPGPGARGFGKSVLLPWANFGPAVTVAAPGQGILGQDLGYVPAERGLGTLRAFSLRDGTSAATAFVTALAAKLAAQNPTMLPSEIKLRLISTVRPYLTEDAQTELLGGRVGHLYAGVIDPKAALRDPSRFQVVFRSPRPDGTEIAEFDVLRRARTDERTRPLWLFETTSESEIDIMNCDWSRLLRLHFEDEDQTDRYGQPIPQGSVVCETGARVGEVNVGSGYFGTWDVKQDICLSDDTCFEAIGDAGRVQLRIADIRDIYFPVIRQ